jgi:hypothetical protein
MLKIAIIGSGMISYSHARAINSLTNCVVSAVADINESSARKLAQENGCHYYTDAEIPNTCWMTSKSQAMSLWWHKSSDFGLDMPRLRRSMIASKPN